MHVEAGIIAAVYRKTLRLSQAARHEQGAGSVVNLMSNDTSRVKNLMTYLHSLWSGPLQIIIAFAMLFQARSNRLSPATGCGG
jgi:ABC-type multidrug transport system fused ATPase/permease subunit